MSTREPKLEKLAHPSVELVALTVKTVGSEAGQELYVSSAELPDATDMKTPALTALAAAELTAGDLPLPPSDMFATTLVQPRLFASLAT